MLTNKKIIKSSIWIASVLSLVISLVCIPLWVSFSEIPLIEPLGINVKNGDRIFYNFLEKVKENDDVIILGTSETGNKFDGKNYWGLLDKDEELDRRFYSFGGAGRCSYMYFPLILDNPEAFKDLEVILYINPTYWRIGLNHFNPEYYKRYVNPLLAASVKEEAIEKEIYKQFIEPGADDSTSSTFQIDRLMDNFKSLYHTDLNYLLSGTQEESNDETIVISKAGVKLAYEAVKDELNLAYNCTEEYRATNNPFPIIDTTTTFQYDMLEAFIQLTKDVDMKCTFYLGPFNEVYCEAMSEERLTEHRTVVNNIRTILEENNVTYIDGSYQATMPGTFLDIQHISTYGAYLTAMDIKKHYEKSN